ncbi:MAG TPA: NUDIX hydrolase [Candidatus Acidoferrum sp.]|nr:NUDIX hydrolase [Candidatus Acidoferrum sp.]
MDCYVMCFVRKNDKFLLVQETQKHSFQWFFPAGGVEPFDANLVAAAQREVAEEAGIQVEIDGVMRFDYRIRENDVWARILFAAHQIGETPLKSQPDKHSECARWVTLDELSALKLREKSVQEVCENFSDMEIWPLESLKVM